MGLSFLSTNYTNEATATKSPGKRPYSKAGVLLPGKKGQYLLASVSVVVAKGYGFWGFCFLDMRARSSGYIVKACFSGGDFV